MIQFDASRAVPHRMLAHQTLMLLAALSVLCLTIISSHAFHLAHEPVNDSSSFAPPFSPLPLIDALSPSLTTTTCSTHRTIYESVRTTYPRAYAASLDDIQAITFDARSAYMFAVPHYSTGRSNRYARLSLVPPSCSAYLTRFEHHALPEFALVLYYTPHAPSSARALVLLEAVSYTFPNLLVLYADASPELTVAMATVNPSSSSLSTNSSSDSLSRTSGTQSDRAQGSSADDHSTSTDSAAPVDTRDDTSAHASATSDAAIAAASSIIAAARQAAAASTVIPSRSDVDEEFTCFRAAARLVCPSNRSLACDRWSFPELGEVPAGQFNFPFSSELNVVDQEVDDTADDDQELSAVASNTTDADSIGAQKNNGTTTARTVIDINSRFHQLLGSILQHTWHAALLKRLLPIFSYHPPTSDDRDGSANASANANANANDDADADADADAAHVDAATLIDASTSTSRERAEASPASHSEGANNGTTPAQNSTAAAGSADAPTAQRAQYAALGRLFERMLRFTAAPWMSLALDVFDYFTPALSTLQSVDRANSSTSSTNGAATSPADRSMPAGVDRSTAEVADSTKADRQDGESFRMSEAGEEAASSTGFDDGSTVLHGRTSIPQCARGLGSRFSSLAARHTLQAVPAMLLLRHGHVINTPHQWPSSYHELRDLIELRTGLRARPLRNVPEGALVQELNAIIEGALVAAAMPTAAASSAPAVQSPHQARQAPDNTTSSTRPASSLASPPAFQPYRSIPVFTEIMIGLGSLLLLRPLVDASPRWLRDRLFYHR